MTPIPLRSASADRAGLIRAAAFRLLLSGGEAVTPQALAEETDMPVADARAAIETLDAAGMIRLRNGSVVGSAGLSVVPTSHELLLEDGARWTWCALDAVAILAALQATGEVRSASPATGNEIRVRATSGVIDASDVVIFVAERDPDSRIVDDWCPTVNFFEDLSTATMWAAGRAGSALPAADVAQQSAPAWVALLDDG